MRLLLALLLLPVAAMAGPLDEYLWLKRPLVVFAATPNDPRFIRQMELLEAYPDDLAERDIVVLTDTDAAARGPLREELHPRDFMLVVVDKDGSIIFRKPGPWSVREISHAVDKTPIREDEIRDALGR